MSRPFDWIEGVSSSNKKSYCPTCNDLTETKKNGRTAQCKNCGCTKGLFDT